ncbi:MAG: UDP-glucose/GDP-mannose dehydrogenase family protein, partial [Weeksellaceae bacterium]
KQFYLGDSIVYCDNSYEAANDADALLLVTEWSEFRMPNWQMLAKLLKNKTIFDGRNIYDGAYLKELGFEYYGIGLKN